MADGIQSISEDDAIEQIVETVQQADVGFAPFALVLGSGFSHGLVPTAKQLVDESLPLWMKARTGHETYDDLAKLPPDKRGQISQDFWKRFVDRNAGRKIAVTLDTRTGLPEDYPSAYRALFTPNYIGAVGEPAEARRFQRAVMRLDQPRLNAAHFLLASLLGVQPGKHRQSALFKARAAFSRLILTTNFDPFLQTALQAVSRLYFMSDTPELGVSDEIFDDQTDAVHLVYLHGSIHRRSQAATDQDIRTLKERNARTLAPVLKRHGVIVLGYSGWDDAIVEALAACDFFDHRLYWCGREADPLLKGAFGPRVTEILRKPTSAYVRISTAGHFVGKLCGQLVKGLPRLLENPIGQLREMLESIDLTELEPISTPAASGTSSAQPLEGRSDPDVLVKAQRAAIERLLQAENAFLEGDGGARDRVGQPKEGRSQRKKRKRVSSRRAARLLESGRVAEGLRNLSEATKLASEVLELSSLTDDERAEALLIQGRASYAMADIDGAITHFSQIVDGGHDRPVERVVEALMWRGFVRGTREDKGDESRKDHADAIADFTRIIDLPGAETDAIVEALLRRADLRRSDNQTDEALADYTRVVDDFGEASSEDRANALIARGNISAERKEYQRAIADYSRVIDDLPDASVERIAEALIDRGVAWGEASDVDKELADYTRVIEQLPGVPPLSLARALSFRGLTLETLWDGTQRPADDDVNKHYADAVADFTRIIDLPEAGTDAIVAALLRRAELRRNNNQTDEALADYTRIVDDFGEASSEDRANALIARGNVWAQRKEYQRAIADYSRVIDDLPDPSVERIAEALIDRGVAWGQVPDVDKELVDYTRVIEQLPGVPPESLARALNFRGLTLATRNDGIDAALDDYSRVIDRVSDATREQLALAISSRSDLWDRQGKTTLAIGELNRVIDEILADDPKESAEYRATRGWLYYKGGDFQGFFADTRDALAANPSLGFASFNLGLSLLTLGRDPEALEVYERAARKFPETIRDGLTDLDEAQKSWLTAERAQPAKALLEAALPHTKQSP